MMLSGDGEPARSKARRESNLRAKQRNEFSNADMGDTEF
jgi:hypothetical protein